jgi:hypothetical protein
MQDGNKSRTKRQEKIIKRRNGKGKDRNRGAGRWDQIYKKEYILNYFRLNRSFYVLTKQTTERNPEQVT